MHDPVIHPASFRDPSGFIFQWNNKHYRQVNKSYSNDYELLNSSGLYHKLSSDGLLIRHEEVNDVIADQSQWYKTILPIQIHYITYPYEWCFSQLRDAALLTLKILKTAIEHGMVLKDATPYNIQFVDGKPLFIDTLSFEKYDPEVPWVAYRQFCNMFLFPLYLEHYLKNDIQKTLIVYPDGIPVNITSKLLPIKSRASLGVWLHVYLQNTVTRKSDNRKEPAHFNRKKLLNLASHLEATIRHLKNRNVVSQWNRYYEDGITTGNYLAEKEKVFKEILQKIDAKSALDLGANTGRFSQLVAAKGIQVIATDNDGATMNTLYEQLLTDKISNILPLVVDVTNPSPATGLMNEERPGFHERIKTDLVIALALIHHLVIGKNIPLKNLARLFGEISRVLIIEFVPREDEKVVQMLASRKDVFQDYNVSNFEHEFGRYFTIIERQPVEGSTRTIYLMEKR